MTIYTSNTPKFSSESDWAFLVERPPLLTFRGETQTRGLTHRQALEEWFLNRLPRARPSQTQLLPLQGEPPKRDRRGLR